VQTLNHAFVITGFVFVMMLIIEYLNVLTRGNWDRILSRLRWGQAVLSSFLGAVPGCLGAFAVVSLYMHRVITIGAMFAAMVATCGDEAFVMLALFPGPALGIMVVLFAGGLVSGLVVDVLFKSRKSRVIVPDHEYRAVHEEEEECVHFSLRQILSQWRTCSPQRGWLTLFLALFLLAVVTGRTGHQHLGIESTESHVENGHVEHGHSHAEHQHEADQHEEGWSWVRITLLVLSSIGLVIVVTASDHFLEEHLWRHLVRVHAWRIFLWTLGALLVTHLLIERIELDTTIASHRISIVFVACLVGLLPASGPHMMFVTLYAQGTIPLSTLFANCIVQDGHGMIPLLAHSRREFIAIKLAKLIAGIVIGLAGVSMGF